MRASKNMNRPRESSGAAPLGGSVDNPDHTGPRASSTLGYVAVGPDRSGLQDRLANLNNDYIAPPPLFFQNGSKQNLGLRGLLISDPSPVGAGVKALLHAPKAVTYHGQPHYCRGMMGHSLGLMESSNKEACATLYLQGGHCWGSTTQHSVECGGAG